jgi:hypothetical protein
MANELQTQQCCVELFLTFPQDDCGLSSISCVSSTFWPCASASARPQVQFLQALRAPPAPTYQKQHHTLSSDTINQQQQLCSTLKMILLRSKIFFKNCLPEGFILSP